MIWVIININRRRMGLIRKQILTCLCLVLLIRLQFDTSSSSFCKVEATSRSFTKFRSGGDVHHSGLSHEHHQFNSTTTVHQYKNSSFHGGFINGSNEDHGDNVFDVDKRRIHTGPNPLHN